MRKILVFFIYFLSFTMPQNEGLVKTYYPNNLDPKKLGAIETEGNYSNGVRNGLWVFWYDGEAYNDWGEDDDPLTDDEGNLNGQWDSSEVVTIDLNGDGFFSKPNKKMEGSYVNGDREGDWFLYYNNKDNTKKEQSLFKSGKLNGQLIKWYENGNKLEEGNYEEGRQNGIWTWYYETGIKKEETQFIDGQQDGLWTQWFPDGQRKSERTFSNGERDNKWTSWYRNGNKKLEANYKNGKLNGMWISWYENGIIKEKSGYYSDNKLDKQWTYWAEDGRKTNETTYERKEKKWSGNKLECR